MYFAQNICLVELVWISMGMLSAGKGNVWQEQNSKIPIVQQLKVVEQTWTGLVL
jgi:hypothetical protein